MHTETAKKELAIPANWTDVSIPKIDAKLVGGTHVYVPAHDIQVATRYPTYSDGHLVASKKQPEVARFLREYNEAHGTNFRYPTLFEDEAMRDTLGKKHTAFDENFKRNECPWRSGYVADFTRPYGDGAEGINQWLVTRIAGWRLSGGDAEIGTTTIAPNGMVPAISRKQLEKIIKKEGLRRLEKLRGKEIYEKPDEIVNVRNPLGYPQLTFAHDAKYQDGSIIPHSHHVYAPAQNQSETLGVRGAGWDPHDKLRCFSVSLGVEPDDSRPGVSFPLVRGAPVKAKITKTNYSIVI